MKLEVSVGEVVDKMTILRIKENRISDSSKLDFIKKELEMLTSMMNELTIEYPDLNFYINQLYQINCSLWDIENSIREKEQRKEFDETFISLARSVYQNNDKRAKIKYDINVLTNSNIREIKQYTEYKNA